MTSPIKPTRAQKLDEVVAETFDEAALHEQRLDLVELDDRVARAFHEAYEDIAPTVGYETRSDSAVPWEDVPDQNRRLMCLVVARLILNKSIAYGTAVLS